MLQPTPHIRIPASEIQEQFIHASGPGGQNVNKVASAVQLRFDVAGSQALTGHVKARLRELAGGRITEEGVLIIDARRHRSQVKNREDAYARLSHWIQRAADPPEPRRPTRPSRGARERRLEEKRARGQRKQLRKPPPSSLD